MMKRVFLSSLMISLILAMFLNSSRHRLHQSPLPGKTGNSMDGNTLVNYTMEKGISWVVWCFDPDWSPYMFTDWEYTPTRQGTFFKKVMSGK